MGGHQSWDDWREGVTDGQKAQERIAFKQGCYWVEECLVRDEFNVIIGKIVVKTLMSNAKVPAWLEHQKMGITDDRPEGFDPASLLYKPKGEVSG